MEIGAYIYAMADNLNLLKDVGKTLEKKMCHNSYTIEVIEPDAALRLSKTWYGFATGAEMTNGPGDWKYCLSKCASILKESGAVVIHFWSPDHPDTYHEYAYTTAKGEIRICDGAYSLSSYQAVTGSADVELICMELMSGRTAADRRKAARTEEKRIKKQEVYGDFEIENGILKRYWGVNAEETIPEGVTEIGSFAFVDENELERHIIEDEEYNSPPIVRLTIPAGVRKISTYALAYCCFLETVNLPDSITDIEERAFEGCEELKRIVLPKKLTEITEYTFFLCEALREVILPEGLKKIGKGAFCSCISLMKISIPAGVEEICDEAFRDCMDLQEVSLHEGLKHIGAEAFKNCPDLKTIRLPKSVETIIPSAFDPQCLLIREE